MNQQSFSNLITQILQLKQDDLLQFYLLTHIMKVQKAGHIPFAKFNNLFEYFKIKTVKQLKKKLTSLLLQLKKPHVYKQMYKLTFSIFLINNTSTLDIDYAVTLWGVLLKDKFLYIKQLMDYFVFLQQNGKKPKRVHKDLWNMMYQFANQVKNMQKDYDEKDAWPVFLDEFVQWVKEKEKKNY